MDLTPLILNPNSFDLDALPPELIYQVCSQMSTENLQNMVKTSRRVHDICDDILKTRWLDPRHRARMNEVTRIMNDIKMNVYEAKLYKEHVKFIHDRKIKAEALKFFSERNKNAFGQMIITITYDSYFNQWYFKFNLNYYPVDEQTIRNLLTDLINNNEKIGVYYVYKQRNSFNDM